MHVATDWYTPVTRREKTKSVKGKKADLILRELNIVAIIF